VLYYNTSEGVKVIHKSMILIIKDVINLFGAGFIFLILAHSVNKMWIIQEPNKLELWNKLQF